MGFLTRGEDFAQVVLGGGEFGFLGFAGVAEFGHGGFEFGGAGLGVDGLLEGFFLGGGITAEPAASTALSAWSAGASAGGAHHAGHAAAEADIAAGLVDFADERFDGFPFVVGGDFEHFAVAGHHAFLHLGGIEVAAVTALALAAAAGLLGEGIGAADEDEGQGGAEEADAEGVLHGNVGGW